MRLKQIKLSGFKSFVDPTTVPYPDNLTSIVGPNGCGKSNIIDAVRWVMGESSAKNLRGESMTDVIFNGSSARKPVGQASVELVFDNSDGQLKGEYAGYNELSIRRTVTRESLSTYYLNGTRCRRKDITDIFLGTGLGARSYAIIEQGMISRLIESKPQELRVFIEEAAGISKYKERRRETENRIRHTRENLERLGDLREELGKQLGHLHRQAQSAEKYKTFKAQERQLKSELAAIRWRDLNQQVVSIDTTIQQLSVELTASSSEQQAVDTDIEHKRQHQIESNDNFNEIQGRYYGVGADIARLEQGLKHRSEQKLHLSQELSRAQILLQNATEHQTTDAFKVEQLNEELLILEPEIQQAKQQSELSTEKLIQMDSTMHNWQSEWDDFNEMAASNTQKTEIQKNQILHFEQQIERSNHKKELLLDEKQQLVENVDIQEIQTLQHQLDELEINVETVQQQVSESSLKINTCRIQRNEKNDLLKRSQQQLQQLQGQKVSLEALQQAALGKKSESISEWLETKKIDTDVRLAEKLEVVESWEVAVETVLGENLQAVVVNQIQDPINLLKDFSKGSVTFLETNLSSKKKDYQGTLTPLATKITTEKGLHFGFDDVFIAESLIEALEKRSLLEPHQSLITKEGVWIGLNWLKVNKKSDVSAGVLIREKKLFQLAEQINESELEFEEQENLQLKLTRSLIELETNWELDSKNLLLLNQQKSEKSKHIESRQLQQNHLQNRLQQLDKELFDINGQNTETTKSLSEFRASLEDLLEVMAEDRLKRESLLLCREERRVNITHVRDQAREDKDLLHKLALRTESISTELNATKNNQDRAKSQVTELNERLEDLAEKLEENELPIEAMKLELEDALVQHLNVEESLKHARENLDLCEQSLRELEKKRLSFEQSHDQTRSKLETENLARQSLSVQRETQLKLLKEAGFDLQVLLDIIDQHANENSWTQQLANLANKIERLGAINLAAIEEYGTQSERKNYLDTQNDDLVEALETLESAIKKIDRETRTKFKETFDKINKGLQELFPKVFGGGHAYLELTGEDLLDTGVTIMARPPGKRNSTIHLLSGGEKAMTAIALVFAIFRLNPAPFCMLDEVDAPLDDANVGRFCRLVREMSESVQFIYISHNKQAMEMAGALIGVTMQEAGVSRMVSVDISEAVAMVTN